MNIGYRLKPPSKVVQVSLAFAKRHRDRQAVRGDKPLRQKQVDSLYAALEGDAFAPSNTWAVADCLADGQCYRVNGKHSSTAIVRFAEDYPERPLPTVQFQEYECDTIEDVVSLYETFDRLDAAKRAPDIIGEYQAAHPKLKTIPNKIVTEALSALSWLEYGDDFTKKGTIKERFVLVKEKAEFCKWLHELKTGKKGRNLISRLGVTAAIYLTWEADKDEAAKFWQLVMDATGTLPRKGDRKLNVFLMKTVTGGNKARGQDQASTHKFAACCLHGWNAWRRGADTDLKYYGNTGELPKAI